MNYLFLLNACILVFLGVYLYRCNRDTQSFRLLIFNSGVAAWSICVFLVNEMPTLVNVTMVARVQLVASLVFCQGLYYFCKSYPILEKNRFNALNLSCFALLALLILGTAHVTSASVVDGRVVYHDGRGFYLYFIYALSLVIFSLRSLVRSYRIYPEFRDTVQLLFIGFGVFILSGTVFNVILPMFGIYDFLIIGRLSVIFPALFFSYAVTKYEFMDISVIINRRVAWLVTFALIAVSFLVAYNFNQPGSALHFSLLLLLACGWALLAAPLQQLLLTSARRKFIRSWYEPDDVLSEIAEQLTVEKNRKSIFTILERVLDQVFEYERSVSVIADRDEQDNIRQYFYISKAPDSLEEDEIDSNVLIERYQQQAMPSLLKDCSVEVKAFLNQQGFSDRSSCMLVPFYSPEHLEGLIVMGERSNQEPYTERDLRFMRRLVSYVSAILYRLTPLEKLEKLYFENRERLHEAEIQLIRAQKIEAIVHATRQCHHEIRTPLNIIKLGIGRIRNQQDLEAYKKVATEEISRAMEIIDETLTVTDVEKFPKDRLSWFDLNEVLRRSTRVIDTERYALDMELESLPEFYGDFSDMQVVITNLIHNALEAMPKGGRLRISSEHRNGMIRLEVEDTGHGIPDELRTRVWEPYFSGNPTEVGNSNAGRGWGLTIVNRIVTEHHGTIKFSSAANAGTTFTISLPLRGKKGQDKRAELVEDKAAAGLQP